MKVLLIFIGIIFMVLGYFCIRVYKIEDERKKKKYDYSGFYLQTYMMLAFGIISLIIGFVITLFSLLSLLF